MRRTRKREQEWLEPVQGFLFADRPRNELPARYVIPGLAVLAGILGWTIRRQQELVLEHATAARAAAAAPPPAVEAPAAVADRPSPVTAMTNLGGESKWQVKDRDERPEAVDPLDLDAIAARALDRRDDPRGSLSGLDGLGGNTR